MLGCRLQSMLAGPPWLGGHHGKGAGEAGMGCSSQGPLSCSPSGHPQLPEIPCKHCRGSQQHGEGMRNQDLAGKNQADRAEKSPALLHPSARPVLGRGGRGVLALVMGTAWRQPWWWWPLSIPGSPITLPPPPTPPNAGFKELQGDGDTPNRLCQSILFGDLVVTPLPGAALSLPRAPPAHTPVSSAWSVGCSSQHQGAVPEAHHPLLPHRTVAMGSRSLLLCHTVEPLGLKIMVQERRWHRAAQRQEPSRQGNEGSKALRHLHPWEYALLEGDRADFSSPERLQNSDGKKIYFPTIIFHKRSCSST